MPALVLRTIPDSLHARLKASASAHHRSLTQEAIVLLEGALEEQAASSSSSQVTAKESYWARRPMTPAFKEYWQSGRITGGTDSTRIISEEREGR